MNVPSCHVSCTCFLPLTRSHCGPADKHLGLCFPIEWANTCVSTEENRNVVICISEYVQARGQIIFFPVMYFRSHEFCCQRNYFFIVKDWNSFPQKFICSPVCWSSYAGHMLTCSAWQIFLSQKRTLHFQFNNSVSTQHLPCCRVRWGADGPACCCCCWPLVVLQPLVWWFRSRDAYSSTPSPLPKTPTLPISISVILSFLLQLSPPTTRVFYTLFSFTFSTTILLKLRLYPSWN